VAIVGRPNVGKSTLVNRVLGEERMIAFDQPGTTRDAIEVEATWQGRPYTIVDTAGIRRKGKVWESVEKFSVVKTLQAIELANVVVLVVDASQDISEQDAHIGGYILEAGRALVVAVNKVDAIDAEKRNDTQIDLERKLAFLDFAEFVPISALQGTGLKALFKEVDGAFAAAMAKLSTPKLTRALQAAVEKQAPAAGAHAPQASLRPPGRLQPPGGGHPRHQRRRHQGRLPPLPREHVRQGLQAQGHPLRVELRQGANPYEGKKRPHLTPRQEATNRRNKRRMKRIYT